MFTSSSGVIALNNESSPLVVADMHQIARARQQNADKKADCAIDIADTNSPLIIILLGKTGNGKSATGNLLVGRDVFLSQAGVGAVTLESAHANGSWKGNPLIVLDTPGLGDPNQTSQTLRRKIEEGITAASCPGARFALVLVFGLHLRVTVEDVETISSLEAMFGKNMMSSAVAVWTHGALLEARTLEEYFQGAAPGLSQLLSRVRGGSIVVEHKGCTPEQAQLSREAILEGAGGVAGALPVPRPLGGKKARRIRQENARKAAAEEARLNPPEPYWCTVS
jgi:hypothetical protein